MRLATDFRDWSLPAIVELLSLYRRECSHPEDMAVFQDAEAEFQRREED